MKSPRFSFPQLLLVAFLLIGALLGALLAAGGRLRGIYLASRGATSRRTLTMTATGYSASENRRWGGKTATGRAARFGVVAVDPRFIKLGTRLYVEGYGIAIAADTGGAIKGPQRADIFYGTGAAAGDAAGTIKDGGRMVVLLPIDRAYAMLPDGL